jgi:CheY-like chemotaxis protein
MSKTGPIIIIDEDHNEQEIYQTVFTKSAIKNKLHFFENGREALDYLINTKEDPFLIICDINMPRMDGMDLRRQISANPYLKKKGTPFVFRTAFATESDVKEAFELSVQGFFSKTNDLIKVKNQIDVILDYWMECLEPPVLEIKLQTL